MHWGIVRRARLAARRLKHAWEIKISPVIFLMYMRLWAQCPLCSHKRLCSLYIAPHARLAQITFVMSPLSGPAGAQASWVTFTERTLPLVSLDVWFSAKDPQLCFVN